MIMAQICFRNTCLYCDRHYLKDERIISNCPTVFDEGGADGIMVKVFGWYEVCPAYAPSVFNIVLQILRFG
jgi:hypothetical protein